VILEATPNDGSFLDVGCATGHLMESIEQWAAQREISIAAYGLEIDPDLAAEARRRLPVFADRIFIGNVSEWSPPRRFTYVRTGLEYVPAGEGAWLLRRLLAEFIEPGGRVIVGPLNEETVDSVRQAFRDAAPSETVIVSRPDRNGKTRYIVWSMSGR